MALLKGLHGRGAIARVGAVYDRLAQTLADTGEFGEALAAGAPANSIARASGDRCTVAGAEWISVDAYKALGRVPEDDLDRLAAQALAGAEVVGACLDLVGALWVQALVALHRDQLEPAERGLNKALTLSCRMPNPHKEAGVLVELKHVPALSEKRRARKGILEQALTIFQHLGARRDVERVADMTCEAEC